MSSYVLIAARDPEASTEATQPFELAGALARQRGSVSVYLTESGVLAARIGRGERWLSPLMAAGVRVFADPGSLGERGIDAHDVVKGIVSTPIERLVAGLR